MTSVIVVRVEEPRPKKEEEHKCRNSAPKSFAKYLLVVREMGAGRGGGAGWGWVQGKGTWGPGRVGGGRVGGSVSVTRYDGFMEPDPCRSLLQRVCV